MLLDIYNIDVNNYDKVINIILNLFNKNFITSEYKNIIYFIYDDIHKNIKYNIKNSTLKFLDVKRFNLDEYKSTNITLLRYKNNNIDGLNCYNFNLYPNIT
jgi:anionic cell wall polymer biosynthesis LytR-Cps2A-Psr (LCP) family protein